MMIMIMIMINMMIIIIIIIPIIMIQIILITIILTITPIRTMPGQGEEAQQPEAGAADGPGAVPGPRHLHELRAVRSAAA